MPVSSNGSMKSTGPDLSTPISSDSQPHWNTATVAPSEMPTDNRNPATALSGTSSERNMTVNRMKANPTTTSRYFGNALARLSEMSTPRAV